VKITILVDNEKSWFLSYAENLVKLLSKHHKVSLVNRYSRIKPGDCLFLLSCLKILPKHILKLNKNNIVIHGSDLPKGRGFSPIIWQILENKKKIVLTLFEANSKFDTGKFYFKDSIRLRGDELLDETHRIVGNKIIHMAFKFIKERHSLIAKEQIGKPTYLRKRTENDDLLPVNESIAHIFDRLRVVDNRLYPAYFFFRGFKYILKIYKGKKHGK